MQNKKLPATITWEARSHQQPYRSIGWYIIFGLLSLGLIAFGIYSHSLLMVVTFCLVITSVLIMGAQKPKITTYKLTGTGIHFGNKVYPYKIIKKFWIVYDPPMTKVLNIQTSAYLNNLIIFQLGGQDPVLVRNFLKQYLLEDLDKEETVTDALARRLKI